MISKVKKEIKFKYHNRFDVFRTRAGKTEQIAYAENIILDGLYARLIGGSAFFDDILLGSGSGVLDPARTTLFTHVTAASAGSTVNTYEWEDGWISRKKSIVLIESANVGVTFTEIGIGDFIHPSYVAYTHALLRDMNGNPVSLLKTDTDIITFFATLYVHWDTEMFDGGQCRLMQSPTNVWSGIWDRLLGSTAAVWETSSERIFGMSFSGMRSPAIQQLGQSGPASSLLADATGSEDHLVPTVTKSTANKKITVSRRLAVAEGNTDTGINCVSMHSYGSGSAGFGFCNYFVSLPCTNVPESSLVGEQVGEGDGSETEFVTKFPMAKNMVVYVDDVAQLSGVTVHEDKPLKSNITWLMLQLFWHPTAGKDYRYTYKTGMYVGADVGGTEQGWCIFKNTEPLIGIESFLTGSGNKIYTSDDMLTWTLAATSSSNTVNTDIPEAHQNKEYWKVTGGTSDLASNGGCRNFQNADYASFKNIVFDAAPAVGAIITVDYDTPVIAKDSDHVFDIEIDIFFGEYVEEY